MSNSAEKRTLSELDDEKNDSPNKKIQLDETEVEIEEEDETIEDFKIEQIFGIRQYTNSNIKGFFGVIKQRLLFFKSLLLF
jgi:hypothetical protein